jgi:hypothetical protein
MSTVSWSRIMSLVCTLALLIAAVSVLQTTRADV